MARRKSRSSRRRIVKSCTPQTISFRTKRGKTVSFKGRSAGQQKAGGKCSNKKRRVTAWMRQIGRAGKACSKVAKPGTARNVSCIKGKLRA